MKIIYWNAQGIKKLQALNKVKFPSRTHKPNLLFLLETLVNDNNIRKILPNMGFDHYDFVPPTNQVGGIAIL